MRVVHLSVSNLLKLKAVEITPAKHIVTVAGNNMQGKSSLLNSIYYALAGASSFPSSPVRQGEDEARIRLDLGEIIVTRKIKANGSTSLVVEAQNGARFPSPQAMLSSLVSGLTFDPLAFTRQSGKEQLETLKKLVKLDVDVDALDGTNARDYEKRTDVNKEVARLKAQLASLVIPETSREDLELDESAILKEMADASTINTNIGRARFAQETKKAEIARLQTEKGKLIDQLAQLEIQIANAGRELGQMMAIELAPLVDVVALRTKAEKARKVGEAKRMMTQRDSLTQQLKAQVDAADQLTLAMSARLKQKEEAISRAEMPIAGLTFGEGEVIYNGVPFSQASQAEALVVSTVIGMALNPRLKILRIADASLLDEHSLEVIGKLAEKGDFQLWLERLASDDPAAIHIEDGSVIGDQAVGMPPKEEVTNLA
jgi:DNA repair exonuclease SbcCD ATPase subunit